MERIPDLTLTFSTNNQGRRMAEGLLARYGADDHVRLSKMTPNNITVDVFDAVGGTERHTVLQDVLKFLSRYNLAPNYLIKN